MSPGDRLLVSLVIQLRPRARCVFSVDSARSVHAALLRQIEHFDPSLSAALHDAPAASHGVVRPWTIANLNGPFERDLAAPAGVYWTRITALSTRVSLALCRMLREARPFALELERVQFDVVDAKSRTTTYRDLANAAVASDRIDLVWRSPTALRRGSSHVIEPSPAMCLASYLRRWNAFADADLRLAEEPLLDFAVNHVAVPEVWLQAAIARPGGFRITGSTGSSTWLCQSGPTELVRQVNLLADYAFYCGTGVKTALGMGQTARRELDSSG